MKNTIKSAILVILSLIMVFSFAACDFATKVETPEITTSPIVNNEETTTGSEEAENTVSQTGDYMNPYSRPRGIEKVIVAGQVIVEDGVITDARPGRVLRHGR